MSRHYKVLRSCLVPLMKKNPINVEEETYLIIGYYEECLQLVAPRTHGVCTHKKKQSLNGKRCSVTGEDSTREMNVTEKDSWIYLYPKEMSVGDFILVKPEILCLSSRTACVLIARHSN